MMLNLLDTYINSNVIVPIVRYNVSFARISTMTCDFQLFSFHLDALSYVHYLHAAFRTSARIISFSPYLWNATMSACSAHARDLCISLHAR